MPRRCHGATMFKPLLSTQGQVSNTEFSGGPGRARRGPGIARRYGRRARPARNPPGHRASGRPASAASADSPSISKEGDGGGQW
eukprot:66241-Hanusia_phi.AAC.1